MVKQKKRLTVVKVRAHMRTQEMRLQITYKVIVGSCSRCYQLPAHISHAHPAVVSVGHQPPTAASFSGELPPVYKSHFSRNAWEFTAPFLQGGPLPMSDTGQKRKPGLLVMQGQFYSGSPDLGVCIIQDLGTVI